MGGATKAGSGKTNATGSSTYFGLRWKEKY